ncbi:MAG: DUF4012 domain-containing protein [Candidatus Moranbacteria bacterium]|nr:DUF4012 domain-containing protein [Candidatus Moranbacteria bacterium]
MRINMDAVKYYIWKFSTKRNLIITGIVVVVVSLVLIVTGLFMSGKLTKKSILLSSFSALSKAAQLLAIEPDVKKELEVVNTLVQKFTAQDNVERRFLILLQNNMELRPGGGFLGQYAIIKIKNGAVTSSFFEDANLLDQRITANVPAPYPFKRLLSVKNWKFRDSNFSPNFPTNVEKAKYFYRLAGGNNAFDGVIAVNSDVLLAVLKLTGPITVPGYPEEYNSENAVLKLEEKVEKAYIMNPEIDTQARKEVLRKMTPVIIEKLFSIGNMTKIAEMAHNELKNKNIMINFADPELQKLVETVYWDGKVADTWGGDFLMLVDANMGAMKSDYYIKRSFEYEVDFTQAKPTVTLNINYKHTAPYGDWRTSDYHTYLRIYAAKGSNFLERKMIGYPSIGEEFGKTYFGVKVDVIIGRETNGMIKYELPENIKPEDYRLLIQKQSGVGEVPVKIHLKTKDGDIVQDTTLIKDLQFNLKKN